MNYMTIQPRSLPRNPIDALIGLMVGLIHLGVVVGLALIPTYPVKMLTHNSLAVVLTCVTAFLLLSHLNSLFVVDHLRCDEDGLEFVTKSGSRKKISWASVESIEEVSRVEVVLCGWLWPRFPPREYSSCRSSLGHYRIRWQGGTAYFPPKDVQRFLYALQLGQATLDRAGHQPVSRERPPAHEHQPQHHESA